MMLTEQLKHCQSLLHVGYESATAGGREWLKNLCRQFEHFCRDLHAYLAHMPHSPAGAAARLLDDTLLCSAQIVDCLAWLEQAIRTETQQLCVLSTCRQHFLDRIDHCLSTMRTSIDTHHTATFVPVATAARFAANDDNFVAAIDHALELLEPFAMFLADGDADADADNPGANNAARRADAILTGQHIRGTVQAIVAHALAFANVALTADRAAIHTVCATALQRCTEFEHTTTASSDHLPCESSTAVQLGAIALESSLYQLDALLNDCLLRIVSLVFGQLSGEPLQQLRALCASEASQKLVDARIDAFDLMSDRLQQIGTLAAAFASTQADRTRLRSACASLEALEPLLLPTLLQTAGQAAAPEPNAELLQQHWRREVARLQRTVQSIVDTDAFCGSLFDKLTVLIGEQQKRAAKGTVAAWLDNCGVLMVHLRVNSEELQLGDEIASESQSAAEPAAVERRLLHADLALMLDECRAAAEACDASEWRRVVKRLKIMQNVLKRFRATLAAANDKGSAANSGVAATAESNGLRRPSMRERTATTFARPVQPVVQPDPHALAEAVTQPHINRSISGILYGHDRSNRKQHREPEPERVDQDSFSRYYTGILPPPRKPAGEKVSWRKRITKKSSLRTTLFKRLPTATATGLSAAQQSHNDRDSSPTSESESSIDLDLSLDLHITDILEKITNLSDTLSNGL